MDEEATFTWGSLRPPPHGRGGLLCLGINKAPTAWARGPSLLWDHRGPRRVGEGAPFPLGLPRPPPHGGGDLFRFAITEAPTAWARGPPSLGDH